MADAFSFLSQAGFQRGLILGVGSSAFAALIVVAVRRRVRPAPVAGLVFAVAATAGMFLIEHPSRWLAIGMAALLTGAMLGALLPAWIRVAPVIPGAMLLAGPAVPVAKGWARVVVAAAIVLGATAVADLDRRWRKHAVAVPMLGATVLGIYATVPDTEEALVALGAMTPVVLLGFPFGIARIGSVGAVLAVGMLGWGVAYGSRARDTAIVGGVACLGMFVFEPLAAWIRGRRVVPADVRSPAILLAAHLAVVFVASRIIGIREQLVVAAAGAIALGVIGLTGTVAVMRTSAAARALDPTPGRRASEVPS